MVDLHPPGSRFSLVLKSAATDGMGLWLGSVGRAAVSLVLTSAATEDVGLWLGSVGGVAVSLVLKSAA
ncbi:MAG: hypothetical protein JWO57_2056, partial [Pseudonocardiales bacterium]|nr:hypothetical protein [Pseudonocardiales bacterium]